MAPQRFSRLHLTLGPTTEHGRFPAIPYEVVVAPDGIKRAATVVEAYGQAKAQMQAEIERRLALARRKEVVLFVHGYNTNFENAALTMGGSATSWQGFRVRRLFMARRKPARCAARLRRRPRVGRVCGREYLKR